MAKVKITRGMWSAVAKELQTLLAINPAIDPKAKVDDLKIQLKESAILLNCDDVDQITDGSWVCLAEIGFIKEDVAKIPNPNATKAIATVEEVMDLSFKNAKAFVKKHKLDDGDGIDLDDHSKVQVEALRLAILDALGLEEPEEKVEEVPEPEKKESGKKKGTPKPEKGKTKPSKKKADGEKKVSCKEVVYLAWRDGEEDVAKLQKVIEGAGLDPIKDRTIASWMKLWPAGNKFPSISKTLKDPGQVKAGKKK